MDLIKIFLIKKNNLLFFQRYLTITQSKDIKDISPHLISGFSDGECTFNLKFNKKKNKK